MKWITTLLMMLFISPSFATVETVLGDIPIKTNPNLSGPLPTTSEPEILISRKQYVISYNKTNRGPNYAIWELDSSEIGNSGRTPYFSPDSDLEKYFRQSDRSRHAVDPAEYSSSCFDRGHVVPSADRSDTLEDNGQTFLMSNMLPQTPYLNRVIWEHFEKHTRDLVLYQKKRIFIVAGPIYDKNLGAIGPNQDIRIPSKEFKIIFITDGTNRPVKITRQTPSITIIMPNIDLQGNLANAEMSKKACPPFSIQHEDLNDWKQYVSTIDEVEKLSGLQIFPSP